MIFGVDFSTSLANVLAKHLIEKYQNDSFSLAKVKVILPTKRACQSLKEAFFQASNGQSILLPQMVPLYEMDKLETDLPPAINEWQRLFLLTKLCQAKPSLHDASKAFQVALSLSELMDLVYKYQVDFSNLEDLVPIDSLAEHWQETVQFLEIIRSEWPKILKEYGRIDQQDRLQQLIHKQADLIKEKNIHVPIIIAGLTADLPAVAHLMRSILAINGDIFLDGVDYPYLLSKEIPSVNHPQYLIFKTLSELKLNPLNINMLSYNNEKEDFIEQAFRHDAWQKTDIPPSALNHLKLILTDSSEQESLTIALLLRQVLESPNKTATLITPDRNLSRRVINQMKRWHIDLDDSAGLPLNHTPAGSFLIQILESAQNQDQPASLLALLKHPLFSNSMKAGYFHIQLKEAEKKARKEEKIQLDLNITPSIDSFFSLFKNNEILSFKDILKKHIEIAEAWASTDTQSGAEVLWSSDMGKQMYDLLCEIISYADILGSIEIDEYPLLFKMMLQKVSAHQNRSLSQRIKILGPIEGRFTHSDVCIIGGLNEQVFPPVAETGPWLNQAMLEKLGLPLPQSKITTMAHDFMHALASPEVYLTRSLKNSGTPTIASRFLERLLALSEVNQLKFPIYKSNLALLAETPKQKDEIIRPAPCPEVSIRPNKLSATNIELLRKNPYAIYAKYILSLKPLNDFGLPNKASLYGQIIHDVLAEYFSHPNNLKKESDLIHTFNNKIEASSLTKADQIFYKILFKNNIVPFIVAQVKNAVGSHIYTEKSGEIILPLKSGDFTLTARADRIDILPHESGIIIDYKTGVAPSFSSVALGYSPQLPIEALILQEGGFNNIPKVNVSDMSYWKLGRESKISSLSTSTKLNLSADEVIQKTKEGVIQLVEIFRDAKTPYEVCPVSKLEPTYNDYKHLARNAEWQHQEEEDDN